MILPRVGLVFRHRFFFDPATGLGQLFRVTKVAFGTAYYRPVDGGTPTCCHASVFHRYARPEDDQTIVYKIRKPQEVVA